MDIPFRRSVQLSHGGDALPELASSIFGEISAPGYPKAGQPNFLAKFDRPM
jgi:hypothetical protein